ncbi:PTS sugar transporter subunit IIB [Allofustis seminis]|uniref:PTS sugar transporter subunit IIB n=1 Tax=Allofustis seminis TaxID=166939 RepID=UPI0003657150|nr:PTS sugar transporter subunit IIB [Allofustis seminis]
MVGIILATHGKFAEGILHSGGMIFGDQEQVAIANIMPEEGPEDIRQKMLDAIDTFDTDEVLFLVDLWGGTPFNQASQLVEEKSDTRALIAGLNLPMLIEAYAARFSMETAHEIATHLVDLGRDGIKTYPESLMPKIAQKTDGHTKGAMPEGTVVGDGKIDIVLARIDTRLLHGQVATAWTRATKPNRIIVVSDAVSKDHMRKKLIEQAAPPGVKANVVPIWKMAEVFNDPRFGKTRALLLFETPQDLLELIQMGGKIEEVNVGSMAHSVGKAAVNQFLSLDEEDVKTYEQLEELGVSFNVRKVPSDSRLDMDKILEHARELLEKQNS